MKAYRFIFLSLWLCIPIGALAQEPVLDPGDPTLPTPELEDALRARLDGLGGIDLKAVVIAGDTGGVALLQPANATAMMVRSNTTFTATVSGVNVKVRVRDVAPAGVEIDTPTLDAPVRIASLSGGAPQKMDTPLESNVMRHVEFHQVALKTALQMIAEQSGGNYTASDLAGKTEVSAFLRNLPADLVVEELCKTHNLWFRKDERSGILRVLTLDEYERDLVSFREETDEVFTLLYPNVLEVAQAIQNLYGERVRFVYPRDENGWDQRELQARFQRFDMINQRGDALGTLGGQRYGGGYGSGGYAGVGGYGSGIGTTVIAGNSGALWSSGGYGEEVYPMAGSRNSYGGYMQNRQEPPAIRNLTPEKAQQVDRALEGAGEDKAKESSAALDIFRDRPASIAVTISPRNNMLLVRTSDNRVLAEIRALVHRMDIPTAMVLLEVKVLRLDLGDRFTSMFDLQFNAMVNTDKGSGLTTAGFSRGEIAPPGAGSMIPGGTGLNAEDMTFQVVNEYFRARMQVLETENRVTTLATPTLLTANNEVSRLFLGEERPLIRNITGQTIITENSTAVTPSTQIEFQPVGTTLLITPNINADRTVTLRLIQEMSSINVGGASIPIVVSTGGVQTVSIDTVASRSISGTFVAKDKMLVAAGGLIEEEVVDVERRVPVLGHIPLLGALFRRTEQATSRRELIVLIRPHVMSTPHESGIVSRNLLETLSIHPAGNEEGGDLQTYLRDSKDRHSFDPLPRAER